MTGTTSARLYNVNVELRKSTLLYLPGETSEFSNCGANTRERHTYDGLAKTLC